MAIPQLFQAKSKHSKREKKRLVRLYSDEIGLKGWREEVSQCTSVIGHTDINVIYCEMHAAFIR